MRIKLVISLITLLAVTACTDTETGNEAKKAAEVAQTTIVKPADDAAQKVTDIAKSAITDVKDSVATKASGAVEKAEEAAKKVEDMAKSAITDVKESVTTNASSAMDKAEEVAQKTSETAMSKLAVAKEAVTAKAAEVVEKAEETAQNVAETAKTKLADAKESVVAKASEAIEKTEEAVVTASAEMKSAMDSSKEHSGADVYKTNCMACHAAEGKAVIAPPIFAVKDHVIKAYPERDAFIARVVSWVKAPNGDDLLMPGAAKKFGVMPAMPHLADADLTAVAEFLYDTDLGQPDWYKEHYEAEHGKAN